MNICNIQVDDVFIGNGVSEMIMMLMQVLFNVGDEVLLFSLDYFLWIVVVSLLFGILVYYCCDEKVGWFLDIEDIKSKINKCIKVIVIINFNNLMGVVYSKELLLEIVELVCEYDLVVFLDEIYDKILYDDVKYMCIVLFVDDVFFVIFSGLFKNYCVVGFCVGWLIVLGNKCIVRSYIEGLNMFLFMCMCVNVFCQSVIQMVFGGYQSINDLIKDGGCFKL